MQAQPKQQPTANGIEAEAGPSSSHAAAANGDDADEAGPSRSYPHANGNDEQMAGPSSSSFAAAAANGDDRDEDGMGPRSMSMESMRSGFLGLSAPDRLDSLMTQGSTTSKDALTHAIGAVRNLGSLPSNPTVEAVASKS